MFVTLAKIDSTGTVPYHITFNSKYISSNLILQQTRLSYIITSTCPFLKHCTYAWHLLLYTYSIILSLYCYHKFILLINFRSLPIFRLCFWFYHTLNPFYWWQVLTSGNSIVAPCNFTLTSFVAALLEPLLLKEVKSG